MDDGDILVVIGALGLLIWLLWICGVAFVAIWVFRVVVRLIKRTW